MLYKLPINENENYLFRVLFLFENQGVFICSHFFSKTLKLFVAACVYMCARSNTFILYRKYFEKISGGFFGVLAMSPTHLRRTSPSLIFSLLSPEEKPRTQETQSVTFGRREVRWKSLNSTKALRRLHSLTCVWIPRDSGNSLPLTATSTCVRSFIGSRPHINHTHFF